MEDTRPFLCFPINTMHRKSPTFTMVLATWAIAQALTGCGVIPTNAENAVINTASRQTDSNVPRATFPRPDRCVIALENSPCLNPMFIGVAVSGGGARAANFGLGVLTTLTNLGLYDDVTAISSVSGGSLAAASFALAPPATNEEFKKRAEVFRTDFLHQWILESIKPTNLIPTLASGRNATRSLADVFDQTVFEGARFEQLGVREAGAPALLINASRLHLVPSSRPLTTRGTNSSPNGLQGFTFTQEAFDELGSDLSHMRIADAVAASGAYPGVFDGLTLQNFNSENYGVPKNQYLHLSDGGTSDNLGVDALLHAYGEALISIQDASCLMIVVDAHVHDPLDRSASIPDMRTGPMDYLISPSFSRAFDLLLDRRREDQLRSIGIQLSSYHPKRFSPEVEIPLDNQSFWGDGWSASRGISMVEGEELRLVGGKHVTHATCAVWHIALDRLLELTTDGNRRQRASFHGQEEPSKYSDKETRDKKLVQLDRFVNTIQTNYKLSVNGKCTVKKIQDSLFEAAVQLTADDKESLNSLEQWLRQHHREQIAEKVEQGLKWYAERGDTLDQETPKYRDVPAATPGSISDSIQCDD